MTFTSTHIIKLGFQEELRCKVISERKHRLTRDVRRGYLVYERVQQAVCNQEQDM